MENVISEEKLCILPFPEASTFQFWLENNFVKLINCIQCDDKFTTLKTIYVQLLFT